MRKCAFCMVLLLYLLLISNGRISADTVLPKCNTSTDETYWNDEGRETEMLWFTHMPSLPLLLKNTESLSDNNCKLHLDLYYKSLKKGILWAVQMFDSSAKNIYGTIDGHTRHLGSFDQCYRISTSIRNKNDDKQSTEINGRYCLVEIKYERKNETKSSGEKTDIHYDPNDSVWDIIKNKGDFRHYKRDVIQLALCVPSSCHAKDIESIIKQPLIDFGNRIKLNITASIDGDDCHSQQEETSVTFYGKLFLFIVISWTMLVAYSTYCDLSKQYKGLNGLKKDFIRCVSMHRNVKELFTVNYEHRGLDSIHALRLIYMILIIFGHGCAQYLYNPVINARDVELTYYRRDNMLLHNGTLITDGFLAISALLLAYNLLKDSNSEKGLSFSKSIIKRYIRLTPTYLLIVLFNGLILPSLGYGPFWKRHILIQNGYYCSKNWWTNILYINNYVNTNEMCMMQSWYLTVNFQFCAAAPFIVHIIQKVPRKIGYTFLTILTVLSMIPPFCMSYFYNAEPFLKVHSSYRIITDSAYFYDYYIKTHMRLTPCLVGFIVGVFIYDYNCAKWRMPKIWSRILIILLGPVLGPYIEILGFQFYDPNVETTPLQTALYASTNRGVFAFSACSIVLLLTVGDGLDVHYKLLNYGWMQPLSKLTFCAFIMHNVLQTYRVATARTARTFTYLNLALWDIAPDLVWCFAISLVIAIVVEMPFRNMEKLIIFNRGSETVPNRKKTIDGIKKID